MKSKRSKATDIPLSIKKKVAERDRERCIFCNKKGLPNAHYISRARGGLGIEQNIFTACPDCHFMLDQTTKRKHMLGYVKAYLDKHYPSFTDEQRTYKK